MGKKWKTIKTNIIDPQKNLEENEIIKYVESLLGQNYKEEKWNNIKKEIIDENNEKLIVTITKIFMNQKNFNKKILCGIITIDQDDMIATCDIIIYQELK